MAGSVNKVVLIGNLGRDPEVRTFQSGGKVCNLRIATSESWKDKVTGERKDRTEWHAVTIYNENIVNVAERFLKKGSKVYLEGQLETRKYEKDGREMYTTEVVLRPFRGQLVLLDGKDGASDAQGEAQAGNRGSEATRQGAVADRPPTGSTGGFSGGGFDDDIPFAPEVR
ncbi:single-stranded DNA-binding protein [Xanthobacter agilis]|uniref:Single-stranded DNA-binding protein n=1 Tax=Xanthobacter agilis TaxID=47492 RepID=A0ABU0LFS9_XANAG|nr:single-stranded DNA-binding protein [Xanthobacter agilis]MDQ0505963.1 single-strand DNA-binding protein [Xanthobacter agilis]